MDKFQKLAPMVSQLGGVLALGGTAVFGAGFVVNKCLFNVEAGHRAVKFSRFTGVGEKVYSEGTHFLVPWVERPIITDVRTRPRNLVSLTGSQDLQMVNITIRTLSRPSEHTLAKMYCTIGVDFDEKVLPSIVNESVKAVVAQFNASQLITQREAVSNTIRQTLTKRAADFNIIIEDVSITHLNFSHEYESAVESKQVAQQQAERAKYMVMKAQDEKRNIIIKAEGDAKAAEMIGEAMASNPGYLELRRLENAREIASIISKSANRAILSSESLLMSLAPSKA